MTNEEISEAVMSPDELRAALKTAKFGQSEFARLIRRSPSAIQNYLCGLRPIQGELALLVLILAAHPELKAEAIALTGLTPEQLKPPTGGAARKKRRDADDVQADDAAAQPEAAGKAKSMIERWAEDDGAGVTVTMPDGKTVVLGGAGKEPAFIDEPEAAKEEPEPVVSSEEANKAEVARLMKNHMKSMADNERRKKRQLKAKK